MYRDVCCDGMCGCVCAWLKRRGAQGTIPCWKQCTALRVVWYLIWSRMFMQHLCVRNCAHVPTWEVHYGSTLGAMQSYSPVKSHFDWGWGEMSGEAQKGENEDGRLESSPCSLWQSEQEALSKVSVHSQKAAAKLQATAWWLRRRVRESRVAQQRAKGKMRNLDF